MYAYLCIYTYMYLCICVCVCVYIYIYSERERDTYIQKKVKEAIKFRMCMAGGEFNGD